MACYFDRSRVVRRDIFLYISNITAAAPKLKKRRGPSRPLFSLVKSAPILRRPHQPFYVEADARFAQCTKEAIMNTTRERNVKYTQPTWQLNAGGALDGSVSEPPAAQDYTHASCSSYLTGEKKPGPTCCACRCPWPSRPPKSTAHLRPVHMAQVAGGKPSRGARPTSRSVGERVVSR